MSLMPEHHHHMLRALYRSAPFDLHVQSITPLVSSRFAAVLTKVPLSLAVPFII